MDLGVGAVGLAVGQTIHVQAPSARARADQAAGVEAVAAIAYRSVEVFACGSDVHLQAGPKGAPVSGAGYGRDLELLARGGGQPILGRAAQADGRVYGVCSTWPGQQMGHRQFAKAH